MSNQIERLVIKFEAEGSGKVKASIVGLDTALDKTDKNVNQLSSSMGRLKGALAAIGVGAALKYVIDSASAYEVLDARLKTFEGSTAAAKAKFNQLFVLNQQFPSSVKDLTDGYLSLKAYGIDPLVGGTMQALIDQTAALGGRQETMQGIILAVGQAWGKQKLEGQEILQLINQGVPVWNLLAKSTGKSVAELQKLSQAGKLGKDVIRGLIAEMEKANKGAAANFNDSLPAAFNHLGDAISFATAKLSDASGFTQAVKDASHWLTDMLNKMSGAPQSVAALNGQLTALESRLQGMSDIQRRMHGGAIQAQVDELKQQLIAANIASGTAEGLKYGMKAIDDQISSLKSRINTIPAEDRTATRGSGLSKVVTEFGHLNQELAKKVEQRKTIYDRLKQVEDSASKNGKHNTDSGFDFTTYSTAQEQALQKQIQQVADAMQTEEERIKSSYQRRMVIVQNADASGLIDSQRAADLEKQLEEQKQTALDAIVEQHNRKRRQMIMEGASTISGAFFTYTSSMLQVAQNQYDQLNALASAAENNGAANAGALRAQANAAKQAAQAAFEENKKAQLLNVVVNTASAIMRAYADLGPVGGSIAAPLLAAAGLAQAEAIETANYSGAAAAPSPIYSPGNPTGTNSYTGAGASVSSIQNQQQAPVQVVVTGNFGWDDHTQQQLINAIQQAYGQDVVLFDSNSAQALALQGAA